MRPIQDVAAHLGIPREHFLPYGHHRAKLHLDALQRASSRQRGAYVLVTGMTPTPLGEGKSTTSIGLAMAFEKLGKRSVVALRQSSLGPVFGAKGGGAGGGRSRIEPLQDSILHVNGDFHAVAQAHNLIASLVDNHLHHGNARKLAPGRIQLRRVLDVNDRALRHITLEPGDTSLERRSGFDITAASEVMAILALADGEDYASAMQDVRARIGRMVVGFDTDGQPVTADDLKAGGAATALLNEAVHPNLMQTTEGTPALLHAGPFANIAHGASSVLADRVALAYADVVVTEAGFGMDIGGEKFFDIKCRASGLWPDVVVLVATARALKLHSGKYKLPGGRALPPELALERPEDVAAGAANLTRQIANARTFGVPVLVAINRVQGDFPSEVAVLRDVALAAGAAGASVSTVFAEGGSGAVELAEQVMELARTSKRGELLYSDDTPLEAKLERVARHMYGADGVDCSTTTRAQLEHFTQLGFGKLPVCIAKTHMSLSHDAARLGAPTGFTLPIRELRLSAGAGFVYALAGSILTMPGLNAAPAALDIDIDAAGNVVGLF